MPQPKSNGPNVYPSGLRTLGFRIEEYSDGSGWVDSRWALKCAVIFSPFLAANIIDPRFELAPRRLSDILAFEE